MYHCRICVTNFREGALFARPHPRAAPKKPILELPRKKHILNRVNSLTDLTRLMTLFILLLLYTLGLIRKAMRNKVKKQWSCRLLEFHNIKFCHPCSFPVGDINMCLISTLLFVPNISQCKWFMVKQVLFVCKTTRQYYGVDVFSLNLVKL